MQLNESLFCCDQNPEHMFLGPEMGSLFALRIFVFEPHKHVPVFVFVAMMTRYLFSIFPVVCRYGIGLPKGR